MILRRTLTDPTRPITVADASVASGLSTRDVEVGLTWLTREYRGHLRVTEDGDLVHLFPYGFTKPWQTEEKLTRIASAVGGALVGAGRFVVRAWLLIVMVAYALLFLALVLGLTLTRQGSSDDRDSPALGIAGVLFRTIADALFWTFHPFSPLYLHPRDVDTWSVRPSPSRHRAPPEPKITFYEKVNRFVFGPPRPTQDPNAMRSKILQEIRAQRGRISLVDVMRVTGMPRDQADPLMARLMLDHDGAVDVGEGGGIVYRFQALRRSATPEPTTEPRAAWEQPPTLPPLTGNSAGANVAIVLLNAWNLLASLWVIRQNLTLANLGLLFDRFRPPVLPYDGVPIALGVVPLFFSVALFMLPTLRALLRVREQKRVRAEHARLAVLREVVTRVSMKESIPDETLRTIIRTATGSEPTSKEVTKRVVELGGDVDMNAEGEIRYRFADLEADQEVAEEERARASETEARLGKIVFASDDP